MKNKTTVILLALFVGSLGVHRFYLGNIVTGIIFVLFFIFFTPFALIIGFIDFLNFLSMKDKTYNKLYNKNSKQCNACLDYINIKATRCKHCGSDNK